MNCLFLLLFSCYTALQLHGFRRCCCSTEQLTAAADALRCTLSSAAVTAVQLCC